MPPVIPIVIAAGALFLIFIVVMVIVLSRCLIVVQPNEAVVLSGRTYRAADGRVVGYRVVTGGRFIRIPFFETVSRIDLTNIPIEVELTGVFTEDKKRVSIRATANVKVASDPVALHNAVERFLDRPRDEIELVARETLEGNLRAVVASLPAEALSADPERVEATLLQEADHDFHKLGLQIDTFSMKNVSWRGKGARSLGESELRIKGG